MGEFKALLKKNFIVWRRNTCGCICEGLTVVLFALLMIYVSTLVSDQPKPKRSYLQDTIQITPVAGDDVILTPQTFAQHLDTTMEEMKTQLFK